MRKELTLLLAAHTLIAACSDGATSGPAGANGGATSANSGATSASGGTASADGGASSVDGGAPSAKGGAPSASGGTASADGGASSADGGAPPANGGSAASDGGSSSGSQWTFPLAISASGRYLVDATGRPFPILARAAHGFAGRFGTSAVTKFLDDTQSKGYNGIEAGFFWHNTGNYNAGHDGQGNQPFNSNLSGAAWSFSDSESGSDCPDFTSPNPAYWANVDAMMDAALARGIAVFAYKLYLGYIGGPQGWMVEMVQNEGHTGYGQFGNQPWADNSKTYNYNFGAWLANRYKKYPNIIWVAAGDYTPTAGVETNAETSVVAGILSVKGAASSPLWSAEWGGDSIATDHSMGVTCNLNGTYAWSGLVASQGRRAYGQSPATPAYQRESTYDQAGPDGANYNPSATQPVRRFYFWGWLTTIGGLTPGNHVINRFHSATQAFDGKAWDDPSHLNSQFNQDMPRLYLLISTIPWPRLVPSGLAPMKTLVVSGASTPDAADYIASAATPEGDLLLAYVPPAHTGTITIDMSAMAGPTRSRWWDPTSGKWTNDATALAASGTHAFTPPGKNAEGTYSDWLLVLDPQQ